MRELVLNPYGAFLNRARQRLYRLLAAATCCTVATGCSLTVPLPGLGSDTTPTGSIKAASGSPFASEMDAEDWRRAKSAMETALDPQGNGASVGWSNPQSGAKGAFVPLAQPYPKDDGICRAFSAVLEFKGNMGRKLRSSACRRNGGDWVVGAVTPMANAANAHYPHLPQKSGNLAERETDTQLR